MESVEYEGLMEEQGGGHGGIRKCKVQPGDYAAISKPLNHNEGKAYKDLQDTPLKDFIPKFHGYHKDGDGQECLIISDLTHGFESVCLADLKVGRRHYDIGATEEKRKGLLAKQKGSTTDSLGVRLIDAKIRHGGEVVKAWDRKQGLVFNYDELEEVFDEFIPPELKSQFMTRCDEVYAAFEATLEQHPGFRMYAASVLVAYDGEKKDELKLVLIDFAHTHINIADDGADPDDEEFEDGVLQGLATLINFAETSHDIPPADKGQIECQIVDEEGHEGKHKSIKKCIVNPGAHRCIMRPADRCESEAITYLMTTPVSKYIPKVYGIQNNKAIVEDINENFSSPCIADFKIGSKSYDIDDTEEVKVHQREKDVMTTTASCRIRLVMALKIKNKKPVKLWKRKQIGDVNKDEESLKAMINEYIDNDEMKDKIATELCNVKAAYEETLKENPYFRMYDVSVLICYDGDDMKKEPRCVFNKLAESHLDIQAEGYTTGPENDDEFLTGISNLVKFLSPAVAERSLDGNQSKCCLLV